MSQDVIRERISRLAEHRDDGHAIVDEATARLKDEVRTAIAHGMTKREVARLAGISRPTLDAWLDQADPTPG